MEINNGKIIFTRGDDDSLIVALTDGRFFVPGDTVYFCVRKEPEDDVDIFSSLNQNFFAYNVPPGDTYTNATTIYISHDQTAGLGIGTYYYTIWIEWALHDHTTVVKPSEFKLVPGGSHTVEFEV